VPAKVIMTIKIKFQTEFIQVHFRDNLHLVEETHHTSLSLSLQIPGLVRVIDRNIPPFAMGPTDWKTKKSYLQMIVPGQPNLIGLLFLEGNMI
jgi:hypothetical protein